MIKLPTAVTFHISQQIKKKPIKHTLFAHIRKRHKVSSYFLFLFLFAVAVNEWNEKNGRKLSQRIPLYNYTEHLLMKLKALHRMKRLWYLPICYILKFANQNGKCIAVCKFFLMAINHQALQPFHCFFLYVLLASMDRKNNGVRQLPSSQPVNCAKCCYHLSQYSDRDNAI